MNWVCKPPREPGYYWYIPRATSTPEPIWIGRRTAYTMYRYGKYSLQDRRGRSRMRGFWWDTPICLPPQIQFTPEDPR